MNTTWYLQAIQQGKPIPCVDDNKGLAGVKLERPPLFLESTTLSLLSQSKDMAQNYALLAGDMTFPEIPEASSIFIQVMKGDNRELRQKICHSEKSKPMNFVVVEVQDVAPKGQQSREQGALYVAAVRLYARCYRENGMLVVSASAEDDATVSVEPSWYVHPVGGLTKSAGQDSKSFKAFQEQWDEAMKG